MTGNGNKDLAVRQLAVIFDYEGRPDITVQLLSAIKGPMDPYMAFLLLDAYCDLGQFESALKVYKALPITAPKLRGQAAIRAINSATMLGKSEIVDDCLGKEETALEQAHVLDLARASRDCLNGKQIDAEKLTADMDDANARIQILQFLCQLDLAAGHEKYRDAMMKLACTEPNGRPMLILLDAYDRHNPRPEMVDIYRTMEWLFPDDPWAVKAVTDGLERHAGAPAVNVAAVSDALKSYPTHPRTRGQAHEAPEVADSIRSKVNPWQVAAAVRLLTEQSDFQSAIDLAHRYTNFLVHPGSAGTITD